MNLQAAAAVLGWDTEKQLAIAEKFILNKGLELEFDLFIDDMADDESDDESDEDT